MDASKDLYALVAQLPQPRPQDIPSREEASQMVQKLETYLLFSRDRHVPRALYDSPIMPMDSRKVGGIAGLVPILVKEQRKRGETIWNAYTKWRMAGNRFEGQRAITKKERASKDKHEWGARMKTFQQEWADPEVRRVYRERIYGPQQGAVEASASSASSATPAAPATSVTSVTSVVPSRPKSPEPPEEDMPPPVPLRDPVVQEVQEEPPKKASKSAKPTKPAPSKSGRSRRSRRSPTPESSSSSESDRTEKTGATTEVSDVSDSESDQDLKDIQNTFVGNGRSSYMRALGVRGF